jgi:hypothetical protein
LTAAWSVHSAMGKGSNDKLLGSAVEVFEEVIVVEFNFVKELEPLLPYSDFLFVYWGCEIVSC